MHDTQTPSNTAEPNPSTAPAAPEVDVSRAEPGLVMRRIVKPDGRYLLLYTFLRGAADE